MMEILFGALAPPIYKQLGCPAPEEGSAAHRWEEDFAAICWLIGRGLLSDREKDSVCRRFLREVEREAEREGAVRN